MRGGVRLGIDVGKARIGVARSDPHGMLATPVSTVARSESAVGDILTIAAESDCTEIVVGLPLSLTGSHTPSTADAEEFAQLLAQHSPVPVRMVDERLSTVSAQSALHASGRTTKNSRAVIDQVAAVIILQHALDMERASSREPGTVIQPNGSPV